MKLWTHIKYRLTRAKTYVGMIQAALATALPYMMGTPYAIHASYALAASSFLVVIMGGEVKAPTVATKKVSDADIVEAGMG